MLKLYGYYRSSASYRVRIALNLKGLKYENKPVHLLRDGGEQFKADYIEKNPMSQIPLLEDGNFRLPQSMAILMYLEDLQPKPELFAKDAKTRARQIAMCELINSGIQPLNNTKVMKYLRDKHNFDDKTVNTWTQHWIDNGFKALETELAKTAGKYSFGDHITAVDCVLVPQAFNALRFSVNLEKYPTIKRVTSACEHLDAFKQAHPSRQPDFEA